MRFRVSIAEFGEQLRLVAPGKEAVLFWVAQRAARSRLSGGRYGVSTTDVRMRHTASVRPASASHQEIAVLKAEKLCEEPPGHLLAIEHVSLLQAVHTHFELYET